MAEQPTQVCHVVDLLEASHDRNEFPQPTGIDRPRRARCAVGKLRLEVTPAEWIIGAAAPALDALGEHPAVAHQDFDDPGAERPGPILEFRVRDTLDLARHREHPLAVATNALLRERLDGCLAEHEGDRDAPRIAEMGLDGALRVFAPGREGADIGHAFCEAGWEADADTFDPIELRRVFAHDRQRGIDIETHPPVNRVGFEARRRAVKYAAEITQQIISPIATGFEDREVPTPTLEDTARSADSELGE